MIELDDGLDDGLDAARWTDEARESFRAAAEELVESVRRHSAVLLQLTGTDADTEVIAEAGELLEAAATAYADTQFELTGTVPPLGLDEEDGYAYVDSEFDEYSDESDDEDEERTDETEETIEPTARLTVLHRADFVVTDEPTVLQAGKEAYHEQEPDEALDDVLDIADLGTALQQIQQAGGIEALADTPGLVSAGATTWVLEATELLDERDPDGWPHSPFAPGEDAERRLLHRLDEVAG